MRFPQNFHKRIQARFRSMSHWRCREPVVIFESDDWGMERKPSEEMLQSFGAPGQWAKEATETSEDLRSLYQVLSQYRDQVGRPACFTSNFVMSNPDFDRIEKSGFQEFFSQWIHETAPQDRLQEYRNGIKEKVFFPQYHGRWHFSPNRWLQDLKEADSYAVELFRKRCFGGRTLLKGQGWRYHSEYMDWAVGKTLRLEKQIELLEEALKVFETVFGFRATSTAAPHYIFHRETALAWEKVGIRYIQATNYHIQQDKKHREKISAHCLGENFEGLLCLFRNVKFDPRPERPQSHWKEALGQAQEAFKNKVPVVIDTHRINYTGVYRDKALTQLNCLLKELQAYQPFYLTSAELGEAICQGGAFQDVFKKEQRRIAPHSSNQLKAFLYKAFFRESV